jgi:dihydrolipoamide dehydrogenase
MADYDVIVIGGGPGGYIAALRCAQLGMTTACVESWLNDGKPALGGTCLNVGCIPSKALLDSSHHYEHVREHLGEHGISVRDASMDVGKMLARKDKIVSMLTQGIKGLFRKTGVDWLQGHGSLQEDGLTVQVTPTAKPEDTPQAHRAANVIIATGSEPITISAAPLDGDRVVDSTGALSFREVPNSLLVIGAGVIGLELGSVWRRLGAQVVILEALPEFLPAADRDIATEAFKALAKQGLDIRLGSKVNSCQTGPDGVNVSYQQDEMAQSVVVDKVIVAVGRRPYTAGLNAEGVGLTTDDRGFVMVDSACRTNLANIYAIGDCAPGPMLAHKASEEGVAVAELIAGQHPEIDHSMVPWVVYTWPEIAWVGQTEQALQAAGRRYRKGSFPFAASGRARAMGEASGQVKILADAETDQLLGAHIFGPNASELIAEAVTTMAFQGSAEDIARTIHAHPTLAEALHEAALGVDDRSLHI